MKLRIEEQTMPVVKFNYNEIKSQLELALGNYKDLIVTEEQLPEIKREQKDLAGLRRKIDSYRKDVKREMSEPIKQFETKCKNLVEMIAEVEAPIKDGINFYEEKQRQERLAQVNEMIQYWVKEYNLTGSFAKIEADERWSNKSITIKEIESGIKTACINNKTRQDRYHKNVDAIKNKIKQINIDLNLASSITENDFDLSIEFDFLEMLNSVERVAKARKQIEIDAEKRAEERRVTKNAEKMTEQMQEHFSKQDTNPDPDIAYYDDEDIADYDMFSAQYIITILNNVKKRSNEKMWIAAIDAAISEFSEDEDVF